MIDCRDRFPFLNRRINGKPVVYFDNAATTQKPDVVLDRISQIYAQGVANVHRSVSSLADETTDAFEQAREVIAGFIGAQSREVVLTHNTTHGLNLVARSLANGRQPRVLTTTIEHHSNLLPWGQGVQYVPWHRDGRIDLGALDRLVAASQPDLVAVGASSNFLGTLQSLGDISEICRKYRTRLLIDAAQMVSHHPIDVRALDCDYLVFSGHKVYGPGGTGVLYIRESLIEETEPLLYGGSMVKEVHAGSFKLNDPPLRFEAGTPNIEGVIGLAAALDFVSELGWEQVRRHEAAVTQRALHRIAAIPGARILGLPPGEERAPLVSFTLPNFEAGGLARMLSSRANVIVRSGFHCAQPAHDELGAGPSVRASFGVYNTLEEVDAAAEVLESVSRVLV